MSQKPGLRSKAVKSCQRKGSLLSAGPVKFSAPLTSKCLSAKQYPTKTAKPRSNSNVPTIIGDGRPQVCAMSGLRLSADAVPRRAMATCTPMAEASSLPLNHLVTIFDTVMPVMSQPMPKRPKPKAAMSTCVLSCWGMMPKSVKGISTMEVGSTWVTAQALTHAPRNIEPVARRPVMRMPQRSRMIPPKKSIIKKILKML